MRRDAVGGMVGLLAIAIALAALPLAPPWPAADSPTDVIRAYFVDHGKQFLMQTFLAWVGFVGFSRVLVGLANVVIEGGERAAGYTAIVGAAVMTAALVFGNVPWAALAYEPPESGDAVRALWNVGLISAFNVTGLSVSLALFPLGVGLLRTKQLPAYYTYMVLITAVIGTVLATCFGRGGPMAPNGPIGMLSILSLTVVLIVGSVQLLRKKVS